MQLQKKCVFVLLNVIVASCAREPSSPICSRYDYEERLLERVLTHELALETTLSDIMKTNAQVVDALKQLKDGKAKVESTLEVMEKKQIEMESRLIDFINNASNNMNSTLAAYVGAMATAATAIKEKCNSDGAAIRKRSPHPQRLWRSTKVKVLILQLESSQPPSLECICSVFSIVFIKRKMRALKSFTKARHYSDQLTMVEVRMGHVQLCRYQYRLQWGIRYGFAPH
ncbi:hypothetical protein DPMN_133662 [Dreissena polymorpha]|uniref:Uncharacterized protein n=1 Tax=Dreissena polymorpha TaxID=45954 RepID=A0A9D4FU09_DREPO|nr:hypothetical protein DPMN_133662 [Dreissena polymorpha]